MDASAPDICTWLLRATFAALLVANLAWLVRERHDRAQVRAHRFGHAAMAAGMLYMTLPARLQPASLAPLAVAYLALATAIVALGVRDRLTNATPGIDACAACVPVAAGSVAAAWMVLLPTGAAAAAPLAVAFVLAGALRGSAALAVAIDADVAGSRLVSPRSGACAAPPPARAVALRQVSYCAMNLAMAAMVVAMAHPGAPMLLHATGA